MHNIKTDFADESIQQTIEKEDYKLVKKQYGKVTLTHVEILKKNRKINKDVGHYILKPFKMKRIENKLVKFY